MRTTIDLSDRFEGHVVLWAKGHYGDITPAVLKKVCCTYTGLTDDGALSATDLLRLVMLTSEMLRVSSTQVFQSVAQRSTGLSGSISLEELSMAFADAIKNSRINPNWEGHVVLLPKPLTNALQCPLVACVSGT